MFEAIRRADHGSLSTLAKTFIGTGEDTAALLCLDHVFSSPLELQGLPLDEIEGSLSLYFDYVRLLNKLRRDESLDQDSNLQRLFGFQALEENNYKAPKYTILYEKLTKRFASSRKVASGYTCGSDEIQRGISQLISSRISDRTEVQNGACRDVHGFSPCLCLLVEGECGSSRRGELCTLQHVQTEQLTTEWYHARLRLILLQFQILNAARYDDLEVKRYVPVHPGGKARESSLNVKLLAWRFILSASSTLPEARIACES
jgi:hypothetical protein